MDKSENGEAVNDCPVCGDAPAATTEREWALFLGDKLVTRYDTWEAAVDSLAWYVSTYGEPSEPLTIGEVECR